MKELRELFPARQVLQVNANLSDPSGKWMADVKAAAGDKDVQCVFLNAGFIIIGMYEQNAVEAHLANLHCNLTSNIWLSHYFYERMLSKELPGCIVFTSSSAVTCPTPPVLSRRPNQVSPPSRAALQLRRAWHPRACDAPIAGE